MKHRLSIPKIFLGPNTPLEEIAKVLVTSGAKAPVSVVNWFNPVTVPEVVCYLAHTSESLCLHYQVTEGEVVALSTADHGTVWMDSCVEIFLQPPGQAAYFNLEMNAIGKLLMACGPNRIKSMRLPLSSLNRIRRLASLGGDSIEPTLGQVSWTLTVEVPIALFWQAGSLTLSGQTWRGNLYKCGDGHRDPHLLSWKAVDCADADFHRPEHFGEFHFL
jgi:hypothetical protein